MATALDAPDEVLDAEERRFVAAIREHGWFCTHVGADDEGPGFSYTTGFQHSLGAPEIIVFAMKPEIAHAVLWDIFQDLQGGASFPTGQRLNSVFANLEAVFLPVDGDAYEDHLGWSRWFYRGDDWPCLQLIWPDRDGRFPWEPDFDPAFVDNQPNLSGKTWPAI